MPNENSGLLIEKDKTKSFPIPRENSAYIEKDKTESFPIPTENYALLDQKRQY